MRTVRGGGVMTEKNKPPPRKFKVILGGKGKLFPEPLVHIPPSIAAKIPKDVEEKLEDVKKLLKKARDDKELRSFFSCIFTGETREHEVPTQAAIESFRQALEIMKDIGERNDPHILFVLYDTLRLAVPERILEGYVTSPQGVDFERIARSHNELVSFITSRLVELFRQQFDIPQ